MVTFLHSRQEGWYVKIVDKSVYTFSKRNAMFASAEPGEILLFKTEDCFSGQIKEEDTLVTDINFSPERTNPSAGPVYINGAQPGDILVVDIMDIEVAKSGVVCTYCDCGPLREN